MAYRCDITNHRPLVGNKVSHANNKTKKRQMPNLVHKSFFSPILKRKLRLRISSRLLRTIDKKGLPQVLKDYHLKVQDLI